MQAGLYNNKNELIKSWKELIDSKEIIIIDNVSFYDIACDNENGVYLILDDSIKTIYSDCINDCYLEKIYISKNVEYIYSSAFDCNSLTHIEVDPENKCFSSEDGILFNKNKTKLIKYPNKKIDKSYTIKNSVEVLDDSAFYLNENIKEVIIPKNVKQILCYCFAESSIEKVTIEGEVLIDNCAFSASFITKIKLPHKLTRINQDCFSACDNLKTIIYPGTKSELEKIKGYKNIFQGNNLTIENIQFQKTLEELIEEGKSLREANKILKEQENIVK